jgi:2-polyprenyl-3-methyl-5-hydroxy-6-metoxy-1,4-benzoquinol methylase
VKQIKILSPAIKVNMADEWYDIALADHFWMEWRYRVISKALKNTGINYCHKQLLEIGCGHGEFIKQMQRDGAMVDGCDLNLFALEKIDEEIKGSIYLYDIFQKDPAMLNKYEGVFLLDVIEHLRDDISFLKTAVEHVKMDGLVIINVPALPSLFSRYDIAAGHQRRYTKSRLHELFALAGLEPVSIEYWGFSLLTLAVIRKFYLKFISDQKIIEKGFKPPAAFANSLLRMLMKMELSVPSKPLAGTSILAVGKKCR